MRRAMAPWVLGGLIALVLLTAVSVSADGPVPPARRVTAELGLLRAVSERAAWLNALGDARSEAWMASFSTSIEPRLAAKINRVVRGSWHEKYAREYAAMLEMGSERLVRAIVEIPGRDGIAAGDELIRQVEQGLRTDLPFALGWRLAVRWLAVSRSQQLLQRDHDPAIAAALTKQHELLAALADRAEAAARAGADQWPLLMRLQSERRSDFSLDWFNGDDDDFVCIYLDERIWSLETPKKAGRTGAVAAGQGGTSTQGAAAAKKPISGPFLWGVSTAGYQWEGGNDAAQWTRFEAASKTIDVCGMAADGLHQYPGDVALARGLGANTFRMSIEWSRIEPKRGQIDPAGVAFYHKLLQTLHAQGLTPVVTLMHFTYPQWLDDELGGWEKTRCIDEFARHVAFVAAEYGREVDWWLTFNEPTVFIGGGYWSGQLAPGKKDPLTAAAVACHLVAAHRRAYTAIHAADPEARVSFNNYAAAYSVGGLPPFIAFSIESMPVTPTATGTAGVARGALVGDAGPTVGGQSVAQGAGRSTAHSTDQTLAPSTGLAKGGAMNQGAGEAPLGLGKPRGALDYIALDYYCNWNLLPYRFVDSWLWQIHPAGMKSAIANYHKIFKLPVLVAENGMATRDLAPRADGWTREAFLVAHVKAMQDAIADGVPVLGYLVWSITDNYEWGNYEPRFGLYAVDCRARSFARKPTPSVDAYRAIIEAGGVTEALRAQYPAPGR